MVKQHLQQLIQTALAQLQAQGKINYLEPVIVQIERSRDKQHGDFASNIALMLAKAEQKAPRILAQEICDNLPKSSYVQKVMIAGPGFINVILTDDALHESVKTILVDKENYGRNSIGQGRRVNLEYLSCNPTGPLHVGHGRGAALGSSLARLLRLAGYDVCEEYFINDAGRQIDILAISVWLRYLQLYEPASDDFFIFPSNGYQGDYIKEIAAQLKQQVGNDFYCSLKDVITDISPDEHENGDKEVHTDALIAKAKTLLKEKYLVIFQFSKDKILADIKDDLNAFGVNYDVWFSEQTLIQDGAVSHAIEKLKQFGFTYEKEGALWFNAVHFGDEKDRVLIRANGQTTYFASDVAYHLNKFERGFDLIVDIFGSDHHGYLARILASVAALGFDREAAKVLIYQFVTLYRGKTCIPMSTRKGTFITLRQLREEVGNDAARFFYLMRETDQPIDFDLDLATSQSNDNPVFYVQYAYARICSVLRQLSQKELQWDEYQGISNLNVLQTTHEKAIMHHLLRYPEMLETAVLVQEPQQVVQYVRELAYFFHAYYNAAQFIVEDSDLRNARLCLIVAVRQVLLNALKIIGVSTPEIM